MKKTLFAGLALLAMNVEAATTMQSGSITNGPSPSASFPLTTGFTYNQFDPALGTLISVTLTISASAGADVDGDNEAGSSATFTADLNGTVTGTLTAPVSATVDLTATATGVLVDADNEPGAGGADFMGTDSAEFIGVNDSGSANDATTVAAELLPYIGVGTLNGTVQDDQDWDVSGGGDAVTRIRNSQSLVDWTVTYEYEPVPEPGSALLGGLALLGLLRRRR